MLCSDLKQWSLGQTHYIWVVLLFWFYSQSYNHQGGERDIPYEAIAYERDKDGRCRNHELSLGVDHPVQEPGRATM